MAGAVLEFEGGCLGFERCIEPGTGKEYLRAVIHSSRRGLTTTAPVEVHKVFEFATEAVKQALLADGYSEADVARVTWQSPLVHG